MPRLQQDTFKVFVSHKSSDAKLADLVASELHALAPDLVECWVSGQALTAGVDWDREIKNQLAESHLLILLFTTPNHTWDWCLYEVGLFDRFDDDEVVSVACLFDPNGSPPAPLNRVQCVPASAADLAQKLVRPLCTHTWTVSDTWQRGALVPNVSDKVVNAVAARLAKGFDELLTQVQSGPPGEVYRYRPCHRIVLDLTDCAPAKWHGIPRGARVVEGAGDTTSYTLSLFRAHDGRTARSWGELVDEVNGRESGWLRDLDESFVQSLSQHLWRPSLEPIEVWQPDSDRRRTYRPVIYEVARRNVDNRPVEVTIMLVPDDASPTDRPDPRSLGETVSSSAIGRS